MNPTTVSSRPVACGSPGSSSLRANRPAHTSQSSPDRSAIPRLSAGIVAWSHVRMGAAGSVVARSSSA
jgi:hypothetical protein